MSKNIHRLEGRIMKRKKKEPTKKPSGTPIPPVPPKSLPERLGISGEVLKSEPKIVITGDYMIEIFNHKGIVDLSEHQIQVNTRKCIYSIRGVDLMIATVTDDELVITGTVVLVEKI